MDIPLPPTTPPPATTGTSSPVEVYSPSHVTSPCTDDEEDIPIPPPARLSLPPAIPPPQPAPEAAAVTATPPPSSTTTPGTAVSSAPKKLSPMEFKPRKQLLGNKRAAGMLQSFKQSKTQGPISIELGKPSSITKKVLKVNKLADDDHDDIKPSGGHHSNSINISSLTSSSATSVSSAKEVRKLNIESIMEEESAVKARTTNMVPLLMSAITTVPPPASALATGTIPKLEPGAHFDGVGFVTSRSAMKAIEETKKAAAAAAAASSGRSRRDESDTTSSSRRRRSRSRSRSRHRSRSPSSRRRRRSTSKEKKKPSTTTTTSTTATTTNEDIGGNEVTEEEVYDLKSLPNSWEECKKLKVDVTKAAFVKLKSSLSSSEKPDNSRSDSSRSLVVTAKKKGEPDMWLDPLSAECEKAFLESQDGGKKFRPEDLDKDYQFKEFSVGGIQTTVTKPPLKWSINPTFTIDYMKRQELFVDGIPDCLRPIIESSTDIRTAADVESDQKLSTKMDVFSSPAFPEEPVMEDPFPVVTGKVKKLKKKEKKEKKEKKKKKNKKTEKDGEEKAAVKSSIKKSAKKKRKSPAPSADVSQIGNDQLMSPPEPEVKKSKRKRRSDEPKTVDEERARKSSKRRRHDSAESDQGSPLQDEHSAASPVEMGTPETAVSPFKKSGLGQIATWEDPMPEISDRRPDMDDRRRDRSQPAVSKLMSIAGYNEAGDDGPPSMGTPHRSPPPSNRRSETPPSDPRLRRYRSGPRTPSRSPPPPGGRYRHGPRTPSPSSIESRRHGHDRHHDRSARRSPTSAHPPRWSPPPVSGHPPRRSPPPPSAHQPRRPSPSSSHSNLERGSLSPRHHDYDYYRGGSPHRYASPRHHPPPPPEHWESGEPRSPYRGGSGPPPYSPGDRRGRGAHDRRRSPSPRFHRHRHSPSYRHRSPPPPGERRYSRSPSDYNDDYRRRRHSPYGSPPPSHHSRRLSTSPPSRHHHHHGRHPASHGRIPAADYYPSSSSSQLPSSHEFRPNSPKRLTLDERLEKELGIKVRDELAPDYSRPPPGYPVLPPGPPGVLPLHEVQQVPVVPPSVHLGLPPVPHLLPPPSAVDLPPYNSFNEAFDGRMVTDPPEEGRLVRVGNMLQIVTEPTSTYSPTIAPVVPPVRPIQPQVVQPVAAEADHANDLMRKMEELKSRKEEEQRLKREKRIQERIQSKQHEPASDNNEMESELSAMKRLPESEPEVSDQPEMDGIGEDDENEARLLAEAISSVPEMDAEGLEGHHMTDEDLHAVTLSDKRHRSSRQQFRYISLKPLAKKERRRQQRLANQFDDDDDDANETFVPRSPVPLPDASTCKSILVQLGFSLSTREKKTLRYADGVVPGQGSPDHTDDQDEDDDDDDEDEESPPQSCGDNKMKRRKRIRLRVIYQKDDFPELSEAEIPPPPPGSPPLYHIQEFIEKFASNKFDFTFAPS